MLARTRVTVIVALLGLPVGEARAWPGNSPAIRVARLEQFLDETEVETTTLGEKLPLEKLLASLAGRLPKDTGFGIEFDREALGKDTAALAALPIRFRTQGSLSLQAVLQDAIGQVPPRIEVDYALRPTGVVLTRPRLAAHIVTHDVGNALLVQGRFLADVDVGPGPVSTVRLAEVLTANAGLRSWETVDVLNGRRLSVFATPARQHAVAALVGSLSRLADLGVYMNARLYEVDRAVYTATVAPVVAGKKGEPAPVAVRVERPLLDQLLKSTLVQESESTKLAPERRAVFLARERLVRNVGLTGVSVAVRPEVSPDRRHLRLHLTQAVAELVSPDGAKGPDQPAEESTIRKTTVAGTVDIRDGEAILMPIDYRPPGPGGAAKVWVVVARPLIWIEAEERERGGRAKPRDVWDETDFDELKRELSDRAKPLPGTADAKAILQAVFDHLLTDKEIAHSREFYGTEADRTILLSNTGKWAWPEGFRPDLHGYRLVTSRPGPFAPTAKRNRVLGVRLDRFEPDAKAKGLFDAPIEVCLFNAGGGSNGAVIGGCSVYYVPKRIDKKWVIEFGGLMDP